jgi:GntR family transcriptional regulator
MSRAPTELDRPVPLYMQVVRQLRARIASGELAEGDRIPSQREMMQLWRISMQTASKVIGALKTEGLAIPSVGRDTIVAPGAPARIAAAAQGTAHAPATPPESPTVSIKTTSAAKVTTPAHVAEILGVPAGRRSVRRQEIRTGQDGEAINVTTAWYPPVIIEKAPRLTGPQPLPAGALAYIAETTGLRAARATEKTSATAAEPATATSLGIAPGSPVLITHTQHHTSDGSLLEYTETATPAGRWQTRTYDLTGT